jgi:hypothetical protein
MAGISADPTGAVVAFDALATPDTADHPQRHPVGAFRCRLGLSARGEALDLKILTVKLILVGIVFVNGVELALKLEPELENAVPANPVEPETPEFRRLMARVRLHGLISLAG